jgi:hypothetical protein
MFAWSGGLFHFKKDLAYNTSKDCCGFYHDVLLNDVFCYFVHNLTKLQNMHSYKIAKDTNIKDLVPHFVSCACRTSFSYRSLPFSKELVAYLETLIYFSFYYSADDPRMSGKMVQLYTQALAGYKDYPYTEFSHRQEDGKLIQDVHIPIHRE